LALVTDQKFVTKASLASAFRYCREHYPLLPFRKFSGCGGKVSKVSRTIKPKTFVEPIWPGWRLEMKRVFDLVPRAVRPIPSLKIRGEILGQDWLTLLEEL
jgi:hypothetical protein